MYLSKTPLRIGLAGGGTDIAPYTHEFGGAVLNATIDKYVYVKLTPTLNDESRFVIRNGEKEKIYTVSMGASNINCPSDFELIYETCHYVLAQQQMLDKSFILEVDMQTNLGGGLGSSSAIVVGVVSVFHRWLNISFDAYDVAAISFYIERQLLKYAGGKQDQYSAAFGGFNFLEFNGENVLVTPLDISLEIVQQLSSHLLLYDTKKQRISGKIISDQQRNISVNKYQYINYLHFLKQQAYDLREILLKGQIEQLGNVLHQGWLNKKMTSDKISNLQLDMLYNSALISGATGGKVLGAGGGGYMLFFCPTDDTKIRVADKLENLGGDIVPFSFVKAGVEVEISN